MFSGVIKEALAKFFKIEELTEHLSAYVEARIGLLKLEVREEMAKAMTRVMVLGVVVLLSILVLIFVSIGFALFINQYFTEKYIGFFFVGGGYFILLIVSYILRNHIFQALEKFLKHHLKHHKE